MEVLQSTTDNRQYYNPLLTAIERSIVAVTDNHHYLVREGWQLIIKMKSGKKTFFHLHLKEGSGGSYATAKMSTLENFPKMVYTGGDSTADVLYMLEQLNKDDTDIVDEITTAESPNQFTKMQKEWLRDTCGIASMYGGICIPYKFLINADEPQTVKGEILIAFSGASQEQDVFFAFWILSTIQRTLSKTQDNIQHSYKLKQLRKNPVIRHWMGIMDIRKHDH